MSTNIAKKTLKIGWQTFTRSHQLQKIFNRNNIKVSYSCMSNVQQLIKKHNNFIQNKKNKTALSCNCGDKNGCPLNGNCRTENVLTKTNFKKVYLCVTEWKFKPIGTINNRSKMKIIKTVPLCQHTCGASNQHLKNKMLIWVREIMRQAPPYSNISKRCSLGFHEKLAIKTVWDNFQMLPSK